MLNQAGRQVLVQNGLHLLGHTGIDAGRPGRDRTASFRERIHEVHQLTGRKIRLGRRSKAWKFAGNIPQLLDGLRGPVRAVNIKSHPSQV